MARVSKYIAVNQKALEPVKIHLCSAIWKVCMRNQWNQQQAAAMMGTSQGNVSRVFCRRTKRLSVGQLFGYLSKIQPDFSFMLSVDNSFLPNTHSAQALHRRHGRDVR